MGLDPMALVYIGLGSNLADPYGQVQAGIQALGGLAGTSLRARSWLYATAPVGPIEQPDYVNAVVALETLRAPLDLLSGLQRIESRHGRARDGSRWGPRILDLDLLVWEGCQLALPGLTLPHPEIRHRAFVLVPMADIAPLDLLIPGQGRLDELLHACPRQGITRIMTPPPRGLGSAAARPLSCC